MASIQSVIDLLVKYIKLLHSKNVYTEGDQTIAGIKNFTGTLQGGGHTVDAIVSSGDGYIRYSSGLQMCFGDVTATKAANAPNANITIKYAKPFTRVASVQLTSKQFNYYSNFAHRVSTDTNNVNCEWWTDNQGIQAMSITCYGFYFAIGLWK